MEKIALSWSSGKDCAMALYSINKTTEYEVASLITSVNKRYDRVSRHGVRTSLLQKQAEAIGIPISIIYLDDESSREEYETKMRDELINHKRNGIRKIAYGDIARIDLRKTREAKLSTIGMEALFPIWHMSTKEVPTDIYRIGFRSIITCVDTKLLDRKYVGRVIDEELLSEIPDSIDKNGENGEYHSFVFDGPIFSKRVEYKVGNVEFENSGYCYCDLL